MTAEDKGKIYQLLLEVQRDLEKFVAETQASTQPVDLDEPIGRVSRGEALQQQQMALANCRQAQQRLVAIENAIQRLQSEEFGTCLECGEEIPLARLMAIPEATRCVSCKEV